VASTNDAPLFRCLSFVGDHARFGSIQLSMWASSLHPWSIRDQDCPAVRFAPRPPRAIGFPVPSERVVLHPMAELRLSADGKGSSTSTILTGRPATPLTIRPLSSRWRRRLHRGFSWFTPKQPVTSTQRGDFALARTSTRGNLAAIRVAQCSSFVALQMSSFEVDG